MYCKIVLEDGGPTVGGGSYSPPAPPPPPPPPHPPPPPPATKFASQGDAHMRTNTQIKFWYYPLCVG